MALFWLKQLLKKKSRPARAAHHHGRFVPSVETLGERILPSVTASFSPCAGVLSVFGDNANNNIVVSRDAAGLILVNGGTVAIHGPASTVVNTSLIQVFGQAGDDHIALDETNGALPTANFFGGAGDDTLIGGSGNDKLFGQAGNDTLLGKAGNDLLFGGAGNDTLIGGPGNDQVFGEAGDDVMIWNPGDGSAVNEGGAGNDTVVINGGNASENYTITANGSRVRVDRTNLAPFSVDIGTSENLVVNANGGDDVITAGNGLAPLIALTLNGGTGNDTITGGDGNDLINGGDGNDVINGGRGSDTVFMGAGDDTFVWNPGDGSDVVEGQGGHDTLQFNGSDANENIDLSANGSRLRLFRDVGKITMDVNEIEQVNVATLGGADTVTVNDLTGTGVTAVNLDLAGTPGSGLGDGQADTVIVKGTAGNDNIQVFGSNTSASVVGLSALVNVTGSEGTNDSLVVNSLGGDDGISASTMADGVIKLTEDGGAGNDTLLGSQGADILIGDDGNDFIQGNQGNDVALMGAGDDTFLWQPGDGSDVVEGGDGTDKLFFFGSNADENFDVSANGSRVQFSRDVGTVTMDLNGVEHMELRTLGGADTVHVGDLTGTDLTQLELGLRGPTGGPNGQPDLITVDGTQGDDNFGVAGDPGGLRVFGLHTQVTIFDQDPTLDKLTLNGLAGNDTIDARSLRADSVQLTLNGGDGDDVITGSDGNDLIIGGRGNDIAFMGAGDDTFVWNPGDGSDVVEGQGGHDTLQFNGSNASENIDLSANGSRLRLFRDVGKITMDVNGVEQVNVATLGSADTVTVNDLTGTDVTQVNLDLAATPGSGTGDGQADTVIVNGTNGDDTIAVSGGVGGVDVLGLAASVHITGSEAANDHLIVNAVGGDDVVDASALATGLIQHTANGGDGNDVLLGSQGNDVLNGGPGDDTLIAGSSLNVLDGGPGDNILL